MTLSIITFDIITLSIVTFDIMSLSIMTYDIITLSIMDLTVTLSINDTQHNNTQHKH
jgi:hypothetical protein